MNRFIITILVSLVLFNIGPVAEATDETLTILENSMVEQQKKMDAAHTMANAARALGYAETHEVILLAQDEWWTAYYKYNNYKAEHNAIIERWNDIEHEYPIAAYIWRYLRGLDYSNEVCAGIMGNIMVEVGGWTLDIQPELYGDGFYGICQWNMAYRDQIWGASLEEQCAFLKDTIEYELDTFGYAYQSGFGYQEFLELDSEEQVALAFAKCYERCNSSTYSLRQECAIEAYEYFIGE